MNILLEFRLRDPSYDYYNYVVLQNPRFINLGPGAIMDPGRVRPLDSKT